MASLTQGALATTPATLVPVDASARSAVSWAAISAGAVVAAATSLALLALGSGLGFAAASPWPGVGPSVATFTVMTGLWLILTQWAASGAGGYIAGRLRTRWAGTHTHEVFFRDTAHGFLTWSLATVIVAVLAATAAGGVAGATGGATAYEADALLRSSHPDDGAMAAGTRAEVARILAHSSARPGMAADDRAYLATLVASRTGLAQADAERRVDATLGVVRKAADDARKAASATAIFTALAMFIGAFIACIAAALGGQQRDEHP
jgi:hypothetical protein